MPREIRVIGLDGVPDVQLGADLAAIVLDALAASGETLVDGDIVVVTHKIISKAEGRLVNLAGIEPSDFAARHAALYERDPRQTEVVLREARRIVRMDRGILIAETSHGFVCANAGVDASNVPGDDAVCLLPLDPDASAANLRERLRARTGVDAPVIVTDSFGRAWRNGIINVAIGVAGLAPLADYRGQDDDYGRTMQVSVLAIADELASAAELAGGKVDRRPVVLIRGYPFTRAEGTGRDLVMDAARDLFR